MNMKCFYMFTLVALVFSAMLSCGGGSNLSADLNLSSQACGNSLIDAGEACDDGNANNSDGCNSHCALEVGEPICGNGILENDECCDDGNNMSGDGCSADCVLEVSNHPPSVPILAEQPASGVIWAPTRLYLSWNPSVDPDKNDQVVYDVYFTKENVAPAVPYKRGITETHFIIQSSTDNRTKYFPDEVSAIYLSPPGNNFDGQYIWKVCARDQHGAQNCSEARVFRTDDSVVGWWRFDEDPSKDSQCEGEIASSSKKICDYSGKRNHGTLQGAVSWLAPENAQSVMGGSINLDGGYIAVDSSASLNLSNKMSVEVIQNLASFGNTTDRPILSKLNSPEALDNTGYAFSFGRGTDLYLWVGNRIVGHSFSADLNDWAYFVGAYDGDTARLYKNNLLLDEQSLTGSILPNSNPLWIGRSSRFNSFFKGSISELLIYSRNLTDDEIRNSYMNYQEEGL